MSKSRGRILIFCKSPIAGKVKTRLMPAVNAEEARDIYERLLIKSIQTSLSSETGTVEICCYPDISHPFFSQISREYPVVLRQQIGNDLGERMHNAINHALLEVDWVIVIGTDCPALDVTHLRQAATLLSSSHDAVITPAEDGGYVLIGMSRSEPQLFTGILWGTDNVYAETSKRLESLQWNWHQLDTLWDVDRPEDMARIQGYL